MTILFSSPNSCVICKTNNSPIINDETDAYHLKVLHHVGEICYPCAIRLHLMRQRREEVKA